IIELRGYSMRDRQRSQMLRGVLDLGRVTVEEIMTHRSSMVSFDAERTIADALSEIGAARFSRFPLWIGDPDHVVGVLHARDLLEADRSRTLADHMRPATFIPRNVRLERQLEAFQRTRTHMALVVDEHGTIKGLVTLEDVVEEIVGDIFDERDMPVDLPAIAADGSLTIDGRVAPRDINRHLDWLLPETEPTLAAILTDHAGRIPAEGETLVIGRHRITVVKRRGHKLATLRVEAPHEPDDG
ncbi:MAG: CBS domain-containing protein, partial [Geminicoccaceae bacterium]|nr:CBS domain-containing protein [Geminicoccaceae bacterium]